MFGSTMFYGDSMITPAISVVSAISGLGVATSSLNDVVIIIE